MNIQHISGMPAPFQPALPTDIGLRIRAVRRARGYAKQAPVVSATKIPPGTYSRIEAGAHMPKIENIMAISDFLDVPVDYLLTGSDRFISAELWKMLEADKGAEG